MDRYNHYIRVNDSSVVIHGFSDAFEQPQESDILIVEEAPRHFHESFTEPLRNERGQYRFKWRDEIVERTQPELDDEWNSRQPDPPTDIELLQMENAMLVVELVETQIRLDNAEAEQANLLLELVDKGVL